MARGRPPKQPDEAKSATLSVRLRPDLKAKLDYQASYHSRSVSEEVESRMIESFADDELRQHLDKLYTLVRSYMQTLGKRFTLFGSHELGKHLDALNLGFELLTWGALKGPLPEARIKQFWIHDIPKLDKKKGDANVAIDAFTTLTVAGLASLDPLKLSEWMRDEAKK